MDEKRVEQALRTLRFSYGAVPLVAGADKFTNLLCQWDRYIAPPFARLLPMRPRRFMRLVGVIEMAAGATVLSGRTRFGGYFVGGWLALIAGNLLLNRDYDIAVRDLQLAIGAWTLAALTEARARRQLPAGAKKDERLHARPTDRAHVPATPDLTY